MKKSIIIDFDHTIGCFEQLVFLINVIEKTYHTTLKEEQIHGLLEKYPLVFRHKLFEILQLILFYEKSNYITFFILYTCNNRPQFVNCIIHYMKKKLEIVHSNLFHFVIFETTRVKNGKRLLETIPKEYHSSHYFCFIDNHCHKFEPCLNEMKYIKSETYIYDYHLQDILLLFPYSLFEKINKPLLSSYLSYQKTRKNKKKLPYPLYEMNSSFILQSIRDFISL